MGFTDVYWTADKYSRTRSYQFPVSGHLGIDFEMVKQDPVTAGWYFNQNQPNLYARPALSNEIRPEYFVSGDGVVPTVHGKARMSTEPFKISRHYK